MQILSSSRVTDWNLAVSGEEEDRFVLTNLPDCSAVRCTLRSTDFEINYNFSQEIFLSWKRMASAPLLMMDFPAMLHSPQRWFIPLLSHVALTTVLPGRCWSSSSLQRGTGLFKRVLPAPWISKPGRVFLHTAPLKRDHSVYLWISTDDFCFLDGIEGETINIITLVIITPFKIFFHSCISHLVNS